MPYVKAKTTYELVEAGRKLNAALEGTGASEGVQQALQDPALNIWITSWVLPALDALTEELT